ncbi:MAG TPA: hypothetical protein VJ722_03260 [Rhodanobacteraceae bacterium]|nr:hypothetical protein [Rhodanobacteraceae bacterium]
MNGRVLHFETPEHREADLLLPWLFGGTIEPQQRSCVETHLAECVRCQREVEWLRELQAAVADEVCREGEAEFEAAWRRLRGRLESRRTQRAFAALQRARQGWRRAPTWTRWVLAAQLAICASLVGVMLQPSAPSASYRTLAAAPDTSAENDARLSVQFDPELSQDRLRDLLHACGARIVDGPTASGAYVLAVPREYAERALAELRESRGVLTASALPAHGKD